MKIMVDHTFLFSGAVKKIRSSLARSARKCQVQFLYAIDKQRSRTTVQSGTHRRCTAEEFQIPAFVVGGRGFGRDCCRPPSIVGLEHIANSFRDSRRGNRCRGERRSTRGRPGQLPDLSWNELWHMTRRVGGFGLGGSWVQGSVLQAVFKVPTSRTKIGAPEKASFTHIARHATAAMVRGGMVQRSIDRASSTATATSPSMKS